VWTDKRSWPARLEVTATDLGTVALGVGAVTKIELAFEITTHGGPLGDLRKGDALGLAVHGVSEEREWLEVAFGRLHARERGLT